MSGFLIQFIDLLITVFTFVILGRVLASWVDPMGGNSVTRLLNDVTEPILAPIRSVLPNIGMIDFSPMVAMILLQVIGQLIVTAVR